MKAVRMGIEMNRLFGVDDLWFGDHTRHFLPAAMWDPKTNPMARIVPDLDAWYDPTVLVAKYGRKRGFRTGVRVTDPIRRSAADLARVWMILHHATGGNVVFGPLRGIAKVSFLQAIDVGRAAARQAGTFLVDAGVLREVDDVFYLTMTELTSSPEASVQELVERRKARRAEYLALSIPPNWKGMPDAIRTGSRTLKVCDVVEGIGVSSGVVEGVARVVLGPDFLEVEPGEILIAPITDPSWSTIMFISDALVVDHGGALSHATIVAR